MEMKGLLVISLLILVAFYFGAVQGCIRIESNEPALFDVEWCTEPVSVALPEPIGYCTNAKCRSSHKTHTSPRENITIGMFFNS